MIGTKLGPYEITAKLGEGGMGEVYRATDTKLDRQVAIKVLPAEFTQDKERLARFEREAKLLAQLHHPNIASIFGLEESEGTKALVMELVEGPTLAERLESGALSLQDGLLVALQIAEALEGAHEKGIVHRDLKPQNIKAAVQGQVKVLDFGLAKAMDPLASASDSASASRLAKSPTLTMGATVQGMILGTAAYMAPEQAKGFAVDKRSDIWAFGVVLYEMLSGRSLFGGDSVGDTLAAVIRAEIDLDRLPSEVPPAIRRLLRRCLERNPKNRLHDIADARIVLQEVLAGSADAVPISTVAARAPRTAWWVAALIGSAGVAAWLGHSSGISRRADGLPPPIHFDLPIPAAEPLVVFSAAPVSIAPDGSAVVFTGSAENSSAGSPLQLYLRRFDRDTSEPIAGTEGANGATFSPDGQSILYAQNGALWKRRVAGGVPERLADVNLWGWRGADWGPDGSIVYAPNWFSPLFRIPPGGGEPVTITSLAANEKSHRFPHFLPDGKAVLFVSCASDTPSFDEGRVEVVRLSDGARKVLLEGGGAPKFLAPSTLLVPRAGQLLAARFDPRALVVEGPALPVVDEIVTSPIYGSAAFDVSQRGDLIFVPGSPAIFSSRVALVSRSGAVTPTAAPLRSTTRARFSPDGKRLLMRIDSANGAAWVFDPLRETTTRVTKEWDVDFPVWSGDGETIYYTLTQGDESWIARTRSDGGGEVERLWSVGSSADLEMAFDGSTLLFVVRANATGSDIYWVDTRRTDPPTLVLGSAANEASPSLSPDGHWLAYSSDASGRAEIFVQSFPTAGRRFQVSGQGGGGPFWSRDGRELFFRSGSDVLVAEVVTGNTFEAGRARRLFSVVDVTQGSGDVMRMAPDGESFVTVVRDPAWHPADRLRVALHWRQELDAALAARGGKTP